jgi:RNA-directed DNA polymerase
MCPTTAYYIDTVEVCGPLLSNLYMRRFVLGWKKLGHEKRLSAHIVNYADDLVICCRDRAEEAQP